MLVLFTFSCALGLLSQQQSDEEDVYYGIKHLLFIAWTLVRATVNVPGNPELLSNKDDLDPFFIMLYTGFYVCVVVLMLNLLIAMINSTFKLSFRLTGAAFNPRFCLLFRYIFGVD